jgi:ATP-binding cassette subfamily C protein
MLMPPLRLQWSSQPQTPLEQALRACAGSLVLVFAYGCSYNLLLLAPSIYLLQIYDRVLSSRSADTLVMLTLIIAFAVVIGGILDALRRAALGRIGAWLDDCLRPPVLTACFEHAYRYDPARACEAYRDLATLRQFAESGACPMLFDVLWSPLFLAVLFLVHPLLGAIGGASALFLLGLGFAGEFFTEAGLERSAAALATSHGRFGIAVSNLHVIKAMGMFDGAARLVQQAALDARREHDVVQRRQEIIMLISRPARALAQVLIMGAAAWLVLEQLRSPGIIFATSLLFGRALAPIEGAIAGWKAFAFALAAYRRLNGVMAATTRIAAVQPQAERPKNGLVVNNVGMAAPGSGHFILKGVSLRLAPGECLGIIGPSGSGKSVLGKILAGVYPPTTGSVLLDNADVLFARDSGQGRRLGYLPQDIDLFGETVKDIIARLNGTDLPGVVAAAKLTGLHEVIARLPQAYDTIVMAGGTNLSRGFRQHLGLARAFFGNPRLVVLDEPNASLDHVGERMLFEAIERLKAANTMVVIITHRIGVLAATDKIAIMQGGTLGAFGDSKDICERYLGLGGDHQRESAPPCSDNQCNTPTASLPQPILP